MARGESTDYFGGDGRPSAREVLRAGAGRLSDLDLVALVLSDRGGAAEARRRADRLLQGAPVALLQRLPRGRLRSHLGEAAGARLLAAVELGHRVLRGAGARSLSSPKHVHDYARQYASAQKEHFLAIHVNARHVPLLLDLVSVGTLSASLVHPREVFRRAIQEGCANLILVHNHPSGDPAPSPDDIEITTRLVRVGELVGIEVLDHVILAAERYFSFREEGMLGEGR